MKYRPIVEAAFLVRDFSRTKDYNERREAIFGKPKNRRVAAMTSLVPKLVPQCNPHPHQNIPQDMLEQDSEVAVPADCSADKRNPYAYYRPSARLWREAGRGWSVIESDNEKFQVSLDVQEFQPDEVVVKVVGNFIMVEGRFIH